MVGLVFSLILPLCLLHGLACAEVTVSGGMYVRNATWEGIVVVDGTVEFDAGTTLNLLPGTEVRFTAPKTKDATLSELVIYGTLLALGTADKPISFIPTSGEGPDAWAGLRLVAYSGQPSRMEHCIVKGARMGISGERSRLEAANLVVSNNRTGILANNGFKLRLAQSQLTDNQRGVELDQNADALLEGNQIANNAEAGIYCRGSSPIIAGNDILKNGDFGIACLNGSSPEISDNRIDGHQIGISIVKKSNPIISYNAIVRNVTGVQVERMTSTVIEHNKINGNDIGISCNYAAYPKVHDNNLDDNWRFAIALGRQQSVEVSRMGPQELRHGIFAAQAGPMKLRKYDRVTGSIPEIPKEGVISAENNWWGIQVTEEMAIAGRQAEISAINDFHDGQTVEFQGKPYPRDRVAYAPWRNESISDAGPRQPVR